MRLKTNRRLPSLSNSVQRTEARRQFQAPSLGVERLEERWLLDGGPMTRLAFDPTELGVPIDAPPDAMVIELATVPDGGDPIVTAIENKNRIEAACANGCQATITAGTFQVQSGVALGSNSHLWLHDEAVLQVVHRQALRTFTNDKGQLLTGWRILAPCDSHYAIVEGTGQPATGLGLFAIASCTSLDMDAAIENVSISGGQIVGTRESTQTRFSGEYGILIAGNVRDIIIRNVSTRGMGGDGLHIQYESTVVDNVTIARPAPARVAIQKVVATNNARNGISLTAGESVVIEDTVVNDNGLIGLDVENEHDETIHNLDLLHVTAEGNAGKGIAIGRGVFKHAADGMEEQLGAEVTDVNVFHARSRFNQGAGLFMTGTVNVYVEGGVYSRNSSENSDSCIAPGINVLESRGWRIGGSVIDHNSHEGICTLDATSFVIENNEIVANTRGIATGGNPDVVPTYVCLVTDECAIRNNQIHKNVEIGIYATWGALTVESNQVVGTPLPIKLNADNTVGIIVRDNVLYCYAQEGCSVEANGSHEVDVSENQSYLLIDGDATLDGIVDGMDFDVWQTNQFQELTAWTSGDFDADGFVDGADFNIWNVHKFHQVAADGATRGRPGFPRPAMAMRLVAPVTMRREPSHIDYLMATVDLDTEPEEIIRRASSRSTSNRRDPSRPRTYWHEQLESAALKFCKITDVVLQELAS